MHFKDQRFKRRSRNHRVETWYCNKEQVDLKKQKQLRILENKWRETKRLEIW